MLTEISSRACYSHAHMNLINAAPWSGLTQIPAHLRMRTGRGRGWRAALQHISWTKSRMSEHQHTNRLIHETSPYLRQHAHNPVDWYAWGEEALARARAEDKPIFLSIGYSACHWCHVMEHESFEDEETAALMNELFVNIKVDREERPDLDAIYMLSLIHI